MVKAPDRAVWIRALALALCCALGLYSRGTSLHSDRCINGYRQIMLGNARVTVRWTNIISRGEWKYSQPLHAKETWISSGLMDQ